MHDARLHRGLWEDRLDRLGEPLKAVHAADEDVSDAAVLEFGEDLHPELGALGLLEPHAEHVALPVDPDPQRQIAGPSLHTAAVADLEHHAVKEQDRVDVLERPVLPLAHVVHNRVGDPADQIPPHRDSVELAQVRLDIPRGHSPAVERQDLLVEPLKAPLALADDLRLKAPVAVPRGADLDPSMLRGQPLRCRSVARVPGAARRLLMGLVTKMVGQLDLHRPLHQPLGQLAEHATGPEDLLLGLRARQQLVNNVIRELAAKVVRHALKDPRRGRRRLAWRLAAGATRTRETRSIERFPACS
jgi:hypothetical protein